MTVYELIQELTPYKPDTEVEFHVTANFSADVEAEFDRNNEDDVQKVTVDTEFDEDVDFNDISDHETSRWNPCITINLTY